MTRNYAYGIMVNGRKRFGGTIHADNMEDAVKAVAKRKGLTIEVKPSSLRPCDGAIIPDASWVLNGQPASIYVWAPPEYFTA